MSFARGSACRRLGGLAFVLLLLLTVGCGDSGTPLQPSSAVQVKVGDTAADRVVALEMTLTSLVLTASNGQQVTLLRDSHRIEFTRLAGTLEPIAALSIPQGSYTEAALTGSDLHLTYIDATGAVQEYTATGEITKSMALNPQLGVTTSSVINVDLNLAASILSIDPTNAEPPQFDPVYTFSVSPVSAGQPREEEGALQHIVGVVSAADSSSFTLRLGQNGISLNFAVDASTAFQDVTLTTLPNMIVEVDGVTAADGSLHAERVAGLSTTSGAVLEGMLFNEDTVDAGMATRSLRRTTAELVVQDGVGNGMVSTLVGTPLAVDFANASYGINGEGMPDGWAFDLIGGLVFNAATIFPGQQVQIVSDTGITPLAGGYTIPARTVTLQEQAASGMVSDYRDDLLFGIELFSGRKTVTPRSALSLPVGAFDLVLPEDSYLHLLTPFTSVTVGIFPQTRIYGANALSNLMNVRVRGWLLYFDEELVMIADRIDFVSTPVPTNAQTSTPHR